MSKKLTRKGVALATGLAFGITGLTAVTPAVAAGDGELASIKPYYGQFMTGVLDHAFNINTEFDNQDAWSDNSMLKIENPTNAQIWIDDLNDYQVLVMKNGKLVEANAITWDKDVDDFYDGWNGVADSTDSYGYDYYNNDYAANVYDDSVLYLELDDYDDNFNIGTLETSGTVNLNLTLWGDRNADGLIGDVEKQYGVATNTLKFVDPATLTPKPLLETSDVDSNYYSIYATVSFAQEVNVEYINFFDWAVSLDNTTSDGVESIDSGDEEDNWADFDAYEDYDNLRADSYVWLQHGQSDSDINAISYELFGLDDCGGSSCSFSVGDRLSAKVAYWNSEDDEPNWKGTKSPTYEILEGDLGSDANGVDGLEISADSSVFDIDGDDAALRADTKSITYTLQAQDGGVDLAESGIPVQIYVSDLDYNSPATADYDWDNSVKITGASNAVNYNDYPDSTITTETDSNGQVEFTVEVQDATAGVEYEIYSSFLNDADSTWNDGDYLNPEYEDAYVNSIDANTYILAGANPTVSFDVTDQFGEPVSIQDGKQLKVQLIDESDSSLLKQSANVVKGTATFTFKNYVESGEYAALMADVYTGASMSDSLAALETNVGLYNPEAAGAIKLDETDLEGNVTYDAFVTGDEDNFASDVYAPNDHSTELSGSVTDANGADLPGAVVTITGKGLQFVEGDDNIYSVGLITVIADEDGKFSVNVWSHEYNQDGIEITVATGGKTAKATLVTSWLNDGDIDNWVENDADDSETSAANEASANVVVTWNAPKHPAVNKTYIVTTVVTDTWGNPIEDAAIDYSAAGSIQINGTDGLTAKKTNASGKSTTYVRSVLDADGFAELTADVTDVDFGDLDDELSLDSSLSLDLVVGKDGSASAGKKAGVLRVSSWNAKGKSVKVYVSGKLVATRVAPTSTYKFKLFGIKSGTKQVKVVVAGSSFFNAPVVIK